MTELGYGLVPEGQRGWDGNWGAVAVQGPCEAPCYRCSGRKHAHPVPLRSSCQHYVAPPEVPDDDECAIAEVLTQWRCPFCGDENEVAGEGAVDSWMECGSCQRYAWLVMV